MYNKIARYIAREMLKHSIIDESKFDVYVYGFELMVAYFVYIIFLMGIAIITSTILESFLFFIGFAIIRKYSGGYHARNYLSCQVLFILNQLVFVIIIKFIPPFLFEYLIAFITFTFIILIWEFSPVDNTNKRFNNNEYVYFKKASRICSVLILALSTVIYCFFDFHVLLLSFLIGVYSATISVVAGYWFERIKTE